MKGGEGGIFLLCIIIKYLVRSRAILHVGMFYCISLKLRKTVVSDFTARVKFFEVIS